MAHNRMQNFGDMLWRKDVAERLLGRYANGGIVEKEDEFLIDELRSTGEVSTGHYVDKKKTPRRTARLSPNTKRLLEYAVQP